MTRSEREVTRPLARRPATHVDGGRADVACLVAHIPGRDRRRTGRGRLAPELLDVAPWPYVVLGAGYAGLAVGLLVIGARRQRQLQWAIERGSQAPLSFRLVMLLTVAGVLLALMTVVLVVAQT